MIFLERLSKNGILDSEYYKFLGNDNDMPNCTRYAHDRAQEACWDDDLQIARPSGGFPTAKEWWNTTSYPKSSEIKAGAVAVFDGTYGHVAFVERVIDDTHALVSQSSYNPDKSLRDWHFWEKRTYELVVGKSIPGTGPLLGFIYAPIDDKRVSRNTSVDQVEILDEMVNVRRSPTTSAEKYEGRYCPVGIYNVSKFDEADGYTWAKIDKNCWVACGDWAKIYLGEEPAPEPEEKELIELVKQLTETLKELKSQISTLQSENKSLVKKVESLEIELAETNEKLNKARDISEELVEVLK